MIPTHYDFSYICTLFPFWFNEPSKNKRTRAKSKRPRPETASPSLCSHCDSIFSFQRLQTGAWYGYALFEEEPHFNAGQKRPCGQHTLSNGQSFCPCVNVYPLAGKRCNLLSEQRHRCRFSCKTQQRIAQGTYETSYNSCIVIMINTVCSTGRTKSTVLLIQSTWFCLFECKNFYLHEIIQSR